MSVIKKIFSRSFTYQIRHGYGISFLRNKREAKALYKMCLNYLSDEHRCKLNRNRAMIFKNTVELFNSPDKDGKYTSIECACPICSCDCRREYYNFYDYVNDHAGWYWT